jgi:hypothetical protein
MGTILHDKAISCRKAVFTPLVCVVFFLSCPGGSTTEANQTGKIVVGGQAQQSEGKGEYFRDSADERGMITSVIVRYHP